MAEKKGIETFLLFILGVVTGIVLLLGAALLFGQHLYNEKELGTRLCDERGLDFYRAEYSNGNVVRFYCTPRTTPLPKEQEIAVKKCEV